MDRGHPVHVVRGSPEGQGARHEVELVHETKGNHHHLGVAEGDQKIPP